MGFVCLPQLAEETRHTGNHGLYDQLTAIRWVRDNITIMGQSAWHSSDL